MGWCEANAVDYIFGLARNARLSGTIAAELAEAQEESQQTGKPARRFKDFTWSTRKSWGRERRVIAKAEWTKGEPNSRISGRGRVNEVAPTFAPLLWPIAVKRTLTESYIC
jgi:hypothetical protein